MMQLPIDLCGVDADGFYDGFFDRFVHVGREGVFLSSCPSTAKLQLCQIAKQSSCLTTQMFVDDSLAI